jgi:hypothetical protein
MHFDDSAMAIRTLGSTPRRFRAGSQRHGFVAVISFAACLVGGALWRGFVGVVGVPSRSTDRNAGIATANASARLASETDAMAPPRFVLMFRPVQAGAWIGMCHASRVDVLKAVGWQVLISEDEMRSQDIADTYRSDQRGFLGIRF